MPKIDVLDSTMFYEDAGEGAPIVFLHGNPTSSHLWRHIMPMVGAPGCCLAPDLIGMGRSGKPNIAYRFSDHARYLDSWFDDLALNGVVLVGHDWGGALAFDWAARHRDRVRGIAFMETIVRPMTWDDFPGSGRARYETLRAPGSGEAKVLERPRAMPINGAPGDVVERIRAYDDWLANSGDIPKLLLTFDGLAGTLLIGAEMTAWCAGNISSLEIQNCGPARHIAPEDQPEAIAAAIASWMDRHRLRSGRERD